MPRTEANTQAYLDLKRLQELIQTLSNIQSECSQILTRILLRETAMQQLFASGISFQCDNCQREHDTGPHASIHAIDAITFSIKTRP
ncbi:unnamed protein product, partial [Mesorhabditis spiculigera]